MNFARFSVTRPVAVTMRIAALVLLGAICSTRLPIDLLPRVSFPTVAVVTQWPNVAPEEIEAQVTGPMEQAVSSVPGLYQVTSRRLREFRPSACSSSGALTSVRRPSTCCSSVERARQRFPDRSDTPDADRLQVRSPQFRS